MATTTVRSTPSIAKAANWEEDVFISKSDQFPGMSKLIFSPIDFAKGIKGNVVAYELHNRQGMIATGLRMVGAPLGFTYSLANACLFAIEHGVGIFSHARSFLQPLSKAVLGLDIVINGLVMIAESFNLDKQVKFSKKITAIHSDTTTSLQDKLTAIRQKYFKVSKEKKKEWKREYGDGTTAYKDRKGKELLRKKHNLAQRVHPWFAKKLEKEIPSLLTKLGTGGEIKKKTVEKAEKLFEDIQTQSAKKTLIHSLAIGIAIALIAIAIVLFCLHPASWAVILVLVLSMAATSVPSALHSGLLNHSGWGFSVQEMLEEKVFSRLRRIPPLVEKVGDFFEEKGRALMAAW